MTKLLKGFDKKIIFNLINFLVNKDLESAIAYFSCNYQKIYDNNDNLCIFYNVVNSCYIFNLFQSSKNRYQLLYWALKGKGYTDSIFHIPINYLCYISLNSINYPSEILIDRLEEWKILYLANEIPFNTKKILASYYIQKDNDDNLFKNHVEASPLYFLRKMQQPNLVDFLKLIEIFPYLSITSKILDYGCGSADLSLLLGKMGFSVSICDIDGGNLNGALKRFSIRGINLENVYKSTPEKPIPIISMKFDLIIALEVVEHVRDPLQLLETFNSSLNNKGIIILGSFPFNSTDDTGDHLIESVSLQNELLKWINTHWIRMPGIQYGNIFRKN
ncbi:methyltransferase domain-containing protein [uncultured Methanospirillum sp.]|uniref:class I SAM-dependent methyltransferase n=1 Tax=uncultured Methanospirillum sp. TaxID=262503 RepID=UPI0029C62DC1|nr:methyltransferase domain-containing protein [uncultured Methanospirillum sp.]